MQTPTPDPKKLLAAWMGFERGEEMPGRVLANLKTGGLRELLEQLAAGQPEEVSPRTSGSADQGAAT